jgi:hypothetical protein
MSSRTIHWALLMCWLPAALAQAQPTVWTNPATGPVAGIWSNPANWSPASVPTSANNAQIHNGGEARLTGSVVASRIEVGKNGGVGILTSDASAIEIVLDSDFDIGEIGGDYATGNVIATGNGTVHLANAARLLVGDSGSGDLDLGQTNATVGAQAHGIGVLSLQSIGVVEILDDADIGQAGGSAVATADGTLTANSVGMFQIGADLDVGQSGGTGTSSATGRATITGSQVVVGSNTDIGRTTGSVSGNRGDGMLHLTDSSLAVGFADPALPGSIHIGDAGASLNLRAEAQGSVTLRRSSADVAHLINIGGLSGGGTNPRNAAVGKLELSDSVVAASQVDVAVIASNTAGSAVGTLEINSSWLDIDGSLLLGDGATLVFGLAGNSRANATSTTGRYGALDTNTAAIAGELQIRLLDNFQPLAGSQFDLVNAATAITGSFAMTSLPPLSPGLTWELSQTANLLRLEVLAAPSNADFDGDGDVDGGDWLTWQRGFGTSGGATLSGGDADGNGAINGSDLLLWEAQFATRGSVGTVTATSIPEPSGIGLALLCASALCPAASKQVRRRCLPSGGRPSEP